MANDILLTSEAYIRSQTPLDDNITGKLLLPAIKLAQDIELTEALGEKLVDSIKVKVDEDTIGDTANTLYSVLLEDYIQPFLCYQALGNQHRKHRQGTEGPGEGGLSPLRKALPQEDAGLGQGTQERFP